MSEKTKILFVCHGNICRSPMAEFVMKNLCQKAGMVDRFEIASAAVSTEEIGNDIYPPAKSKLREKGVPFEQRGARQITRADYEYYDYIVCADRSNLRWMERLLGDDTECKVSLMMAWPQTIDSSEQFDMCDARDVSDPWYTGDFEMAYQDIFLSCCAILNKLM
ncbi:MAG: low molecular weight phosphotyrosine protein phosphatase [Paludibacteraceae bacterium]|nr:low molecular weight phosphotyrosine protein phosphatase [Paludibacteraceae bacterium]